MIGEKLYGHLQTSFPKETFNQARPADQMGAFLDGL